VLGRLVGSRGLRVVVVLGLLAFVASRVSWDRVVERLKEGEWEWFALACLALAAALVLGAIRWMVLLRRDPRAHPGVVTHAYAAGVFTNGFLPTSFGGDMARAVLLSRDGGIQMPKSLASVLADRMLGFVAVFVVGWAFVLTSVRAAPGSMLVTLAWATLAVAAALLVAIAVTENRSGWLGRVVPARVQPPLRELRDAFRGHSRDHLGFALAGLVSLAYQALIVTEMALIARAVDVDVRFGVFGAVLPLVLVATLVPFSVGGLGIREGSFVLLLSRAGVDTSDATVISLLALAALTLVTAPCGLTLLDRQRRTVLARRELPVELR
jgi:glycosyltransferase 2 family protein